MPQPAIDFKAILRLLDKAGIRYVVIGGVAMHLQGANNLTLDMDISYSRDRENTQALAAALTTQNARFRGMPPELPCVIDAQTLRNTTNLTLETTLGDFDLLASPEGIDSFEALWERAAIMDIEGMIVRVASIDDLIAMKRVADRPKDREHIMELEALKRLKADEESSFPT
jgi:predicted nucleotidyltransferase